MPISRRRSMQLTLGTWTALAFGACVPATSQPSQPSEPTTSTAEPRRLRIAYSFPVQNLVPEENGYPLTSFGAAQTLYYCNLDDTIRPWIASGLEPNGDEGWTVKLNPAARFQNGKPIDSKVVQACLERLVAAGAGVTSLRGATYETPDAQTLRIKTSQTDAWIPYHFATSVNFQMFDVSEVPPKPDPASLIGKSFYSGMFKVRNLTPDVLTLDAWPDAWDGAPKLAGADVRFVKDPVARMAALKSGEVDLMWPVLSAQVAEVKATPGLFFKRAPTSNLSHFWLTFNLRRAPFSELPLRQAIAAAIDRKQLADQVLNGVPDAPDGLYPSNASWNLPGVLKTDVAAAKKTLDDAGWVPGADAIRKKGDQRLAFTILYYPQQPDFKPLGEGLQAQLKAVGMEVSIKQVDDIDAALRGDDWDAALYGGALQYGGNPMYGLERRFLTDSPGNYGGWGSAELDSLIKKARVEFDATRRGELLKQVQQVMVRDVPVTLTVSPFNAVIVNSAYSNYIPSLTPNHYAIRKDVAPD